jgi:hypothetical protein
MYTSCVSMKIELVSKLVYAVLVNNTKTSYTFSCFAINFLFPYLRNLIKKKNSLMIHHSLLHRHFLNGLWASCGKGGLRRGNPTMHTCSVLDIEARSMQITSLHCYDANVFVRECLV